MTTPFDGLRAIREEIAGLLEVRTNLVTEQRRAQEDLGRAEVLHNNLVKLRGFADAEVERKRTVMRQLEEELKRV